MARSKLKFALIADIHFGPAKYPTERHQNLAKNLPEIVGKVVATINSEKNLEFVLNLGDLVQENSKAPSRDQDLRSAATVLEILSNFYVPLYHTVGNHDLVTLSPSELESIFRKKLYYSFETENFKNIVLFCDSPAHVDVHLIPGETEWLISELENATKPVCIFMHQLLVEHPLEGTSCEGIPQCAYVRNRQEIKAILAKSGKVRAVFNGHMHSNLFKVEENIAYVSIQAMTEPIGDNDGCADAYAIVEFSGSNLVVEVRGNDPATFRHSWK